MKTHNRKPRPLAAITLCLLAGAGLIPVVNATAQETDSSTSQGKSPATRLSTEADDPVSALQGDDDPATGEKPFIDAQTTTAQQAGDDTGDDDQQKYRVVLQLNERSLGSLNSTGFAKARVPENQIGNVVALKLISPGSFFNEPAVVTPETENVAGVMTVKLTDEMVQHLQVQPLEVRIYESNFANILLVAEPGVLLRQPPLPEVDLPDTPGMYFRLPDDRGIMAHIADRTNLEINSVIGNIEVPLDKIQAANFNFGGELSVFLVLKDGSRLSGVTTTESVRVTSKWGDHTLGIRDLEMMTPDRETRLEVVLNEGNILYRTVQGTSDIDTLFRQ